MIRPLLVATLLSLLALGARAQSNFATIIIRDIELVGNERTRDASILRELNVAKGDTVVTKSLPDVLDSARQFLVRTSLFNQIRIWTKDWQNDSATIVIEVEERWYLFPGLSLELADRNLNEWWELRDRSIRRWTLGLNLTHHNLRGRADVLVAGARIGYNKGVELRYRLPFVNDSSALGLGFKLSYLEGQEIDFATVDHQVQVWRTRKNIRNRFSTELELTRRQSLFRTEGFALGFTFVQVDDSVLELNPTYFEQPTLRTRYVTMAYRFDLDHRDSRIYPNQGHRLRAELRKDGLGLFREVNRALARLDFDYYKLLTPKVIVSWESSLSLSAQKSEAYIFAGALGQKHDVVRGYEKYAIDAPSFIFSRITLKPKVLDTKLRNPMPKLLNMKAIPLKMYVKIMADAGGTFSSFESTSGKLANNALQSVGVGLDVVTVYDLVLSLNFNLNSLGETGFFVHRNL